MRFSLAGFFLLVIINFSQVEKAAAQQFDWYYEVKQNSSSPSVDVTSINVDSHGNLFFVDESARSICVHDSTGTRVETITQVGSTGSTIRLKSPSQVYVDDKDNLYVYDKGPGQIVVRKSDGNVFAFGERGSSPGQVDDVKDIAVDDDGYIYVLNGARKQVDIFSPDGLYVSWITGSPDTFSDPVAIGASCNELYVLEEKGPSVFVYDISGSLVNTNRELSRKPGIFMSKPQDMVVMRNGDFIILDGATCTSTQFDRIGNVVATLGSKGESGHGVFRNASSLGISRTLQPTLAILDRSEMRVQLFQMNRRISYPPSVAKRMQLINVTSQRPAQVAIASALNGISYVIPVSHPELVIAYRDTSLSEAFNITEKFGEAVALATDSHSRLYVLDKKNREVAVFDSNGSLLRKIGKEIPEKLKEPLAMCVNSEDNLIVADHANGNFHLWNRDGVYQRIITNSKSSGIESPRMIHTDSRSRIYVWDDKLNAILRLASAGSPVSPQQIRLRGFRHADREGEIGGFYLDALDQVHIYNKTTSQLEVYSWENEPVIKFTIGRPGQGANGFSDVSYCSFDRSTFHAYFSRQDGTNAVYQFMLRPPAPEVELRFDFSDNKLSVNFNPLNARSVIGYGIVMQNTSGEDSLIIEGNNNTLSFDGTALRDIRLHHYNLVSVSHTNYSDHGSGFDDYYGYACRLLAAERYDEAFIAYGSVLEKMGNAKGLQGAVSSKLCVGGRALALKGEVVKSLQFLRLAHSLTPDDPATANAYAFGFSAFFSQLANRGNFDEIILEAERLMTKPYLRKVVWGAIDSLCAGLARIPNEQVILNAISLQRRLVEWDPANSAFLHSLATSHYELYKFKLISLVPGFEIDNALKDAEKYSTQAVAGLKKDKKEYVDAFILNLKILNAGSKFADAEKRAQEELTKSSYSLSPANVVSIRLQLAQAYSGTGKHDLAVLEYERVIASEPGRIDVQVAYAEALIANRKPDDARQVYQQLLISNRDHPAYVARIGEIELLKGNFVEASFQIEKATKLDPSEKSYYGPLAEAFDGAGNYQEALEHYAIAIQYHLQKLELAKNSFSSPAQIAGITDKLNKYLASQARLNEQVGDFEAAVANYNEMIRLNPENAIAHHGLGKALLNTGRIYDAVISYYAACRLDPTKEAYTTDHSNALKLRDQQSKSQPPLTILELNVNDVFPSLYRNYSDTRLLPVGVVIVANNTAIPITPTSITVFVKDLMTEPTHIKVPAMVGYSNTSVSLSAIFSEKILTYTSEEKFQAEVQISYNHGNASKTVSKVVPFKMYGRNAITWSDKRRLGAFVSHNVDVLVDYNKKADLVFRNEQSYGLNKTILRAMQVYTLLNKSSFTYSPDPVQSFATVSTQTEILDFLQYPCETLRRKSGDCDDLVALYAALLENSGIPAAYIDVPGHVFVAFDSQIKPSELVAAGLNPLDVIIINDKVWIPVETTFIGSKHFMLAWRSAAARYYDALTAGLFPELVSLADARNVYVPSSFVPAGFAEEPPSGNDVLQEYAVVVSQLLAKTKKEVIAEMESRYLLEPENVFVKNKYAMLLARIGEFDRAEAVMNEAVGLAPASAVVLNNLGNLYYMRGNAKRAIEYYLQAAEADNTDGEILINLCKAYVLGNNNAEARICFDKAILLNTTLSTQYQQLKQQLK